MDIAPGGVRSASAVHGVLSFPPTALAETRASGALLRAEPSEQLGDLLLNSTV
jgi:hypothetical protein